MTPREQQIVDAALAQAESLRQKHGSPQVIRLSRYASDADLRQLRPEDGPDATCQQQERMTQAVAAALRAAGHPVQIRTLSASDYLAWLTDHSLPNTAANRAAYLTLP